MARQKTTATATEEAVPAPQKRSWLSKVIRSYATTESFEEQERNDARPVRKWQAVLSVLSFPVDLFYFGASLLGFRTPGNRVDQLDKAIVSGASLEMGASTLSQYSRQQQREHLSGARNNPNQVHVEGERPTPGTALIGTQGKPRGQRVGQTTATEVISR